jgi:hypothetical protein
MDKEMCGVCFNQCPCATCGCGLSQEKEGEETMKLVNLTPHAITLVSGDTKITLPSEGIARVDATPGTLRTVEGVPVPIADPTVYGEVIGLPEPQEGTLYVVSLMVLERCRHRADVVAPGTGPKDLPIRNAQGQIEGVTRLVR